MTHLLQRGCFAVSTIAILVLIRSSSYGAATPVLGDPDPLASIDPQIRRVTPHVFAIGAVSLDQEQRTVSFPVSINQRTGIVEYAVVTTAGKTHESVFRTVAQPVHIHIAMLLLGVKPASTNSFPADLSVPPPGEAVSLEVSWPAGNREVRHPLEEFIVTGNNQHPLPPGPWIYNGSYLARRNFMAQRDGSIVSVHIDPDALVNNPRSGRDHDDLHEVNSQILPPDGLPLEITLRLSADRPPTAASPTNALAKPNPSNPADPPPLKPH